MRILCITVIAAGLAAGMCTARADNLIANPNFSGDVAGWTADTGSTISYDANLDANASGTSGSMAVSRTSVDTFNLSAHQCFSVAGGSDFSFGAKVIPGIANSVGMTCSAFASLDCTGKPLGNASAIIAGSPDPNGWVPLRTESPYLLPAPTQSVACAVTGNLSPPLRAGSPQGGPSSMWADNVFFGAGTTPVSLQGFDID
ncbi:MAG: hypothetical protein ABIW82_06240 [Dokdonella sp.]